MQTRRDFLIGAASLATVIASRESAESAQNKAWNSGDVAHLLPTVNHQRFLIKASFTRPQQAPPALLVDKRKVSGRGADTLGLFWTFDATGLEPGRRYELQLARRAWPRVVRSVAACDVSVSR